MLKREHEKNFFSTADAVVVVIWQNISIFEADFKKKHINKRRLKVLQQESKIMLSFGDENLHK